MENIIKQSIANLRLKGEVELKVETAFGSNPITYILLDKHNGRVLYAAIDGGRVGTWLDGFSTARNRILAGVDKFAD